MESDQQESAAPAAFPTIEAAMAALRDADAELAELANDTNQWLTYRDQARAAVLQLGGELPLGGMDQLVAEARRTGEEASTHAGREKAEKEWKDTLLRYGSAYLTKNKLQNIKTTSGLIYLTTSVSYTAADANALREWVKATGNVSALQARVSKEFVDGYIEQQQQSNPDAVPQLPPGVSRFAEVKALVRQ